MGDRCYLQVVVANSDVDKFMDIVQRRESWSAMEEHTNHTEFEEYEANYAMYDELMEAAKAGCLFYGYHGSGSEYGPGEFFGADREYSERECGHNGGHIVRTAHDDIIPEDAAELREFLRARRGVKERIENPLYDLVRGTA